jgi:hypothetical protein
MADLLDGEVRYYPKQPGSDLEITNVRIISKGSVYSTNYIANIGQSQTESKERKPWELLWIIGAVIFIMLFLRDLIEPELNLLMLSLAVICGFVAFSLYKSAKNDVPLYFIHVKMTTGDEISLSFKEPKDREEVFDALSKALAFWRIHQTPATKTRMERFHSS